MPSQNRIEQINGEISKLLSALIPKLKDPRIAEGLVSVVRVDTSGDLSQCRVYVSSLGGNPDIAKGLKSAANFLRRELGLALKLRHTPELIFIADDSIKEGVRILGKIREVTDG